MNLVNCDENLQPMWQQFKNLQSEDIDGIFINNSELLGDEVVNKFKEVSANKVDRDSLLQAMTACETFGDDVWRNLLLIIRDRESKELDKTKTVAVVRGGRVHHMTVEDLEDDLMEENPNLMMAQTSIPAELIHDDPIEPQFNTEVIQKDLESSYLGKKRCSFTQKPETLSTQLNLLPIMCQRVRIAQKSENWSNSAPRPQNGWSKYRVNMFGERWSSPTGSIKDLPRLTTGSNHGVISPTSKKR